MLETFFFFSLAQVKHEITPLKQKSRNPSHSSNSSISHRAARTFSCQAPELFSLTVSIFQAVLFVCLSSSSSVIVKFFAA